MRTSVVLLAALAAASAQAVTKHYSFSNGYPTTTTRQPTQAASGTFGTGNASKKPVEKTFAGTVTQVESGDVVWVTPKGGRRTKVLLDRVAAPQWGQPFGVEAKKFLFDLANGREVTVRYWPKDRSSAIRGTVFVQHEKGLVEVNLTMIRNGCAWYEESKQSVPGSNEAARARTYAAAQADAKKSGRGLWAAPNPVNPAEWRKQHR